jgi:L-ascorbate metabolism protein UlaG (beta-lactamase superfamily)
MHIVYFGHSAFCITLDNGTRIVLDPYTAGSFGGGLAYGPIKGSFDAAVMSHDHEDHTSRDVLKRSKTIVKTEGGVEVGGAEIELFPSFHDEAKGAKRGKNLISIITAEGLRIAHLGDLGHLIGPKDIPALTGIDVLMIPVGGFFTVDAATAARIVKELAPKIVLPMHYKTSKADFPISSVEYFTKLMDNVERPSSSEIEVTKALLPVKTTVVVLEPAN